MVILDEIWPVGCLSKPSRLHYFPRMSFNKYFVLSALLFCGLSSAFADTIQLKGNDAVTGKILTEKPDAVVVDVGYTVLVVPRSAIVKISQANNALTRLTATASPLLGVNAPAQFYYADGGTRAPPRATCATSSSKSARPSSRCARPAVWVPDFSSTRTVISSPIFTSSRARRKSPSRFTGRWTASLDREIYKKVRIVAINKFQDLALLKIEDKNAPKFKYVTLGSSDALSVGEPVFAIGSPMGLERTVTEGILSTKTRELEGELYLQTTAQINPGNSGGPLFDMAGNVIGVTNMKIMFGEGLGFAIPVELVKNFLDHRDAFAYSTDNPNTPYRYLEPPGPTSHKPAE